MPAREGRCSVVRNHQTKHECVRARVDANEASAAIAPPHLRCSAGLVDDAGLERWSSARRELMPAREGSCSVVRNHQIHYERMRARVDANEASAAIAHTTSLALQRRPRGRSRARETEQRPQRADYSS